MLQAVINAFGNAISGVFAFIPRLVGFLVILLVGWIVAWAVDKALTVLLRKVGFDRLSDRVGLTRMEQQMGMRMDAAQLLGRIAFWFIFLIFLVPATDSLGLPTVSNVLNSLVDYIPNIFVAVLVLFLGSLVGIFLGDIAQGAATAKHFGNARLLGNITRWAVIGFAGLIALEQLQIAPALITVLFTAVVASAALAFGLAFGLGGRETAQRMLARSEGKLITSRPYNPDQIVQQARSDLGYSEQMGQPYTPPQSSQSPTPPYGTQPNVPPATSPGSQTYQDPRPTRPSTPRS